MTLARTALEAGSSHLFIVQQSEARQHVNLPASAFEGRFLKDKKSDICCLQISRFTASKPSKSAIASVEKFTRQLTTLIARYFLKESLYQQTERLRTVAAVLKDSLRVAICCHREDGMATDSRRYGGFGNHNAKLTVLPFNGRYRAEPDGGVPNIQDAEL